MEQYISKSALVAEIKKRFDEYSNSILRHYDACTEARASELSKILVILNTLEVKEVDLEKEIEEHVVDMPMSEFTHESEVDDYWDWARKEFRHFFELGLKAKDK